MLAAVSPLLNPFKPGHGQICCAPVKRMRGPILVHGVLLHETSKLYAIRVCLEVPCLMWVVMRLKRHVGLDPANVHGISTTLAYPPLQPRLITTFTSYCLRKFVSWSAFSMSKLWEVDPETRSKVCSCEWGAKRRVANRKEQQ
jgi:hypothetical protein